VLFVHREVDHMLFKVPWRLNGHRGTHLCVLALMSQRLSLSFDLLFVVVFGVIAPHQKLNRPYFSRDSCECCCKQYVPLVIYNAASRVPPLLAHVPSTVAAAAADAAARR
jgi:hypothetical protein